MPKPKIDRVKLSRMLNAGKSQRQVAQVLGVTEGAVSKAKKELNINVVKNVALETAHRVVDKKLDTLAQLQKINDNANELLDLLMRWNRGDDEALQVLETQVRKIRIGKGENVEWVKEYKFKDPRELALRAMGEIRGQMSLQLEIFKTMSDLETIREFQAEVLTAIGETSKEVRDAIIKRLKEKRALRTSVQVN
jgi:hypothetical protein